MRLGGVPSVHRHGVGRCAPDALALDAGDGSQVGRGTDDDAHRHVDVEDIVQQFANVNADNESPRDQ